MSTKHLYEQSFSDEYLEPVSAEEAESDSGKFVIRQGKKSSTSKPKYDKPSKISFSKPNFLFEKVEAQLRSVSGY